MNYIIGLRIFFFVSVFNNLVLTVSNSIDVKQKLKWIHEGKIHSISKNQRFLNYFRMEQPNYKHLLLNFLKSFLAIRINNTLG